MNVRRLMSNSVLNFSDIWNLGEYCRQKQQEYAKRGMLVRRNCVPNAFLQKEDDNEAESPSAKRMKTSEDSNIHSRNVGYFRAHYTNQNMPKVLLHAYAGKNGLDNPIYTTIQEDSLFQTVVTFQDKKYSSSYWEKNKRFAEHGAALVCLLGIGQVNEEDLIKSGSLTK